MFTLTILWHPCLRYFYFLSVFFIVAASPISAKTLDKIAASGVIKLGIVENAEPFAYFDGDKPLGYSVDICLKVAEAIKIKIKRSDLKIKFIKTSYGSRISDIVSEKIDLECGLTTNNDEHRKFVDFSVTIFISESRILVRKDSSIRSAIDLNNKRIVAVKKTTHEKILRELINRTFMNITPIYSNSDVESFALLESNKVDVVIAADIILYRHLIKSENKNIFKVMPNSLSWNPISVVLRKDDFEFKKVVDNEIRRIMKQGEIVDLYKKWFESPIPPWEVSLDYPMTKFVEAAFENPSDWVSD